jgi:hypothetical protein
MVMDITIQDNTEEMVSVGDPPKGLESDDSVVNEQTEAATRETERHFVQQGRLFQPRRFAIGLLSTASGAALILGVGFRVVEMQDLGGGFTLPLVGVFVLTGVLLLGGGFGVMATSSSGFDEDEFDRLASAGNISAVNLSDDQLATESEVRDSLNSL